MSPPRPGPPKWSSRCHAAHTLKVARGVKTTLQNPLTRMGGTIEWCNAAMVPRLNESSEALRIAYVWRRVGLWRPRQLRPSSLWFVGRYSCAPRLCPFLPLSVVCLSMPVTVSLSLRGEWGDRVGGVPRGDQAEISRCVGHTCSHHRARAASLTLIQRSGRCRAGGLRSLYVQCCSPGRAETK